MTMPTEITELMLAQVCEIFGLSVDEVTTMELSRKGLHVKGPRGFEAYIPLKGEHWDREKPKPVVPFPGIETVPPFAPTPMWPHKGWEITC